MAFQTCREPSGKHLEEKRQRQLYLYFEPGSHSKTLTLKPFFPGVASEPRMDPKLQKYI